MILHDPKKKTWHQANMDEKEVPDALQTPGALRSLRMQLASKLQEIADMRLPGDEALLLRTWLTVFSKVIGKGSSRAMEVHVTPTWESLDKSFADCKLRDHNTKVCIEEYILPELRVYLARDPECQRLMSCLGETGPFV